MSYVDIAEYVDDFTVVDAADGTAEVYQNKKSIIGARIRNLVRAFDMIVPTHPFCDGATVVDGNGEYYFDSVRVIAFAEKNGKLDRVRAKSLATAEILNREPSFIILRLRGGDKDSHVVVASAGRESAARELCEYMKRGERFVIVSQISCDVDIGSALDEFVQRFDPAFRISANMARADAPHERVYVSVENAISFIRRMVAKAAELPVVSSSANNNSLTNPPTDASLLAEIGELKNLLSQVNSKLDKIFRISAD